MSSHLSFQLSLEKECEPQVEAHRHDQSDKSYVDNIVKNAVMRHSYANTSGIPYGSFIKLRIPCRQYRARTHRCHRC